MVKVVRVEPNWVMLDVGGAVISICSRNDKETELIIGGTTGKTRISDPMGKDARFESRTLYLNYESIRDNCTNGNSNGLLTPKVEKPSQEVA